MTLVYIYIYINMLIYIFCITKKYTNDASLTHHVYVLSAHSLTNLGDIYFIVDIYFKLVPMIQGYIILVKYWQYNIYLVTVQCTLTCYLGCLTVTLNVGSDGSVVRASAS